MPQRADGPRRSRGRLRPCPRALRRGGRHRTSHGQHASRGNSAVHPRRGGSAHAAVRRSPRDRRPFTRALPRHRRPGRHGPRAQQARHGRSARGAAGRGPEPARRSSRIREQPRLSRESPQAAATGSRSWPPAGASRFGVHACWERQTSCGEPAALLLPAEAEAREDALAAIRSTLSDDEVAAAIDDGRRLRLDEVLTEMRGLSSPRDAVARRHQHTWICNRLVTRVGERLASWKARSSRPRPRSYVRSNTGTHRARLACTPTTRECSRPRASCFEGGSTSRPTGGRG